MHTSRLYIQRLSSSDTRFMLQLVNSKGWLEFIGNRNVTTEVEALSYINNILESSTIKYWVVRLKATEIPIGIVSLVKRDYLDFPDIGFAFLPGYANQGFAFESVTALIAGIKPEIGYPRLLATTLSSNINSIKLLKKLGMSFDKEINISEEVLQVYSMDLMHS